MLVDVNELIRYMSNIALTEVQKADATQSLLSTQQELELWLNRPVEPVRVREVLCGDYYGFAIPSITPIHSVLSITPVGSASPGDLEVTQTTLGPDAFARVMNTVQSDEIASRYTPGNLYVGWGRYIVDYIGGYVGYTDDALKQGIMQVAGRAVTASHDDFRTIKFNTDETEDPDPKPRRGWTQDELLAFDRLRRRTAL